jgi:hypothetical protein
MNSPPKWRTQFYPPGTKLEDVGLPPLPPPAAAASSTPPPPKAEEKKDDTNDLK